MYKKKCHPLSITYISGWQRKDKFSIKSSRSPQSRIDSIYPICSSNDYYLPTTVQPIHQSKESGHNGGVDLVLTTRTNRGKSINLIKEDDGRSNLVGLILDTLASNEFINTKPIIVG